MLDMKNLNVTKLENLKSGDNLLIWLSPLLVAKNRKQASYENSREIFYVNRKREVGGKHRF